VGEGGETGDRVSFHPGNEPMSIYAGKICKTEKGKKNKARGRKEPSEHKLAER
jgi:hypothetical protein